MIRSFAALSLLLVSTTSLAAPSRPAADPAAWDVNAPPGAVLRQVQMNVSEGTWMNVDVSPDGRTIAFDLLGDIYTMPIAGGHPTRITSGLAFDMQPRFSPDGRMLAFTSDRGGGDNIWVINADGSGARQITHENFRMLNAPTWSRDGQYIAARKHFTTTRSAGTGEIWLYHVSGVGDGVPLVERPNPQFEKELGEPTFSGDGRSIYFSRNTTPGNVFIYAQDSNREVFAIERYDMATGERTKVAGGPGGAVRPTPSPDGQWLAYVHRTGGHSRLFVKNLRSGEDRQVYADLDQDLQETWAIHGVYPDMAWTPDSNTIVFWAGGKIRRVNRDGTGAAEIPFQINDTRVVIDPPHPMSEGRAADRDHPHAALLQRLAGRQPGRLRKPRPALHPRRRRQRRAAPTDRAGRRLPALPDLVARRPHHRLRLMERPEARRNPHSRARWERHAHGDAATRPLPPPALLARRRDHRLRSERQPGPDLQSVVGRDRRLPRPRCRRPGDADPRRRHQPAIRRRSEPRLR